MKRTLSLVLVGLLVAGLVAAVPLGAAADEDETDDETLPGERLAGVVGTQEAELDGELAARSFGIAVANAETDEERADVIADRLAENEQRLGELEERHETLRADRDAGEMREGAYRAQVTIAVAETGAVNRTTNQAAVAADGLPDDLREERGIDSEAIRTLQQGAADLTGPEVADIARGIAGDDVGDAVAPVDRPDRDQRGGNGDRGGASADDETPDGDEE